MLAGVPVIVTTACGVARYLTNGVDSAIVQPGSAKLLREKIEKLMKERKTLENIALQGQKTAQKKFTLERMVEKYERVLSV